MREISIKGENLNIYNTLTKSIESFVPINNKCVSMYNCGPTLHNFHTQIGNLRSYTFSDLVKRYLLFLGYKVNHVIKITDVDDHSILESQENKTSLKKYTDSLYNDYVMQLTKMNIILPTAMPKVTENIEDMVESVQKLSKLGYTYVSNGSIYFRVHLVKNYGSLVNFEKQIALHKNAKKRIDFSSEEKENINDFCLWKAWVPKEGSIFWNTSIGKGRPGWHLGCSVLSRKYLENSIDIHIGGISHIFPHHTNEIAISEALTGKKFVKYWLHHEYLIVNGEKMSKTKGTLYTLKEILNRDYHPMILRYLLLKTHYRKKLNFSWDNMHSAKLNIMKIIRFLLWLESIENKEDNSFNIEGQIHICQEEFESGLNEDFNISKSLKSIFGFMNTINQKRNEINIKQAKAIFDFIMRLDEILGFIRIYYYNYKEKTSEIITKKNIGYLIMKRNTALKNHQFEISDEITKELLLKGIKFTVAKNSSYIEILE